ncbi:MAG TPA: response regulator [Sphingomonas sp.]|uniref:response regulator n=1 Tax=Sphingomonas sp. TaxID=28214 RepID=UPI002ED9DB41
MTSSNKGPRVLIVEDESLVRSIAHEEFADAGFDVVTAEDGRAAVDLLNGGDMFDLLFTDIRMPGTIDGWSVATAARRAHPDIAVIYATGFFEEPSAMVADARFFKKPYRLATILEAARQLGVDPARG